MGEKLEQYRVVGDVLSVTTVVATIVGVLPAISALFAIAWSIAQLLMNWDKITVAFKKHILRKK